MLEVGVRVPVNAVQNIGCWEIVGYLYFFLFYPACENNQRFEQTTRQAQTTHITESIQNSHQLHLSGRCIMFSGDVEGCKKPGPISRAKEL
jgi:hypothetical protein